MLAIRWATDRSCTLPASDGPPVPAGNSASLTPCRCHSSCQVAASASSAATCSFKRNARAVLFCCCVACSLSGHNKTFRRNAAHLEWQPERPPADMYFHAVSVHRASFATVQVLQKSGAKPYHNAAALSWQIIANLRTASAMSKGSCISSATTSAKATSSLTSAGIAPVPGHNSRFTASEQLL